MKSLTAILAPPLMCLGIVGGIAWEKSTHVKPSDAEPYHARAERAVKSMKFVIGDPAIGVWHSEEIPPTKAAVELLRTNTIVSRRYVDEKATRTCDVLIVHCTDSRDMVGHYPENCYPSSGETLIKKQPRTWTVAGEEITGTEYEFERFSRGQSARRFVYSFLLVPGEGIAPDIKALNKAAEDYQRRHYGATQFQFVMPAYHVEERDRIFTGLMGSNVSAGMLDVLRDVRISG